VNTSTAENEVKGKSCGVVTTLRVYASNSSIVHLTEEKIRRRGRNRPDTLHTGSMTGTRPAAFASSIMATADIICPDVQKPH
jgi:hypothetical protein